VSIDQATHDDFDYEPVPGLPEQLPQGEHVLWSDIPDWKAVALDVFHIRAIAFYAALIMVWRGITTVYDGGTALDVLASVGLLALVFGSGLAMLTVLAVLTARSTRYTITNKRIVMRIGVALTMSVNLPFKQILSADYRDAPFGTGAIALTTAKSGGLGYLVLWPHARPFHFSRPQPMLRGIKDGERVARILATALAATHDGKAAPAIHVKTPSAHEPVAA
jgi:hypothetical protein